MSRQGAMCQWYIFSTDRSVDVGVYSMEQSVGIKVVFFTQASVQ